MATNRPSAVATTVPDGCVTVVNHSGVTHYEGGKEAVMDREHIRLCTDPIVVVDQGGDGIKWSGTLPSGEGLLVNEYPDGKTSVSVKTCECFKMIIGTEEMPLPEKPPADNPAKENAPCLYQAGEHTVPTYVAGCPVTGVMIINCNDAALAYELNFSGC